VTENVGKRGVQMTLYPDLGQFAVRTVGFLHQGGRDRRTPFDHFLGIAA
jgi:hypothetical protein